MSTSVKMKLSRDAATANAIRVLLDEFEGGEFTSCEGKALLKKHREGVCFDTLKNSDWFDVSRTEYFDLPASVKPFTYRITFTDGYSALVREDYHCFVGKRIYYHGRLRNVLASEALEEDVQPRGKRYYYTVRKDYAQKMAREFVRKEDVESAMRKLRNKMANFEADYESLKALEALRFDSED